VLVSIPLNKGAEVIKNSGMGDSLNYIPTNKHTLQSDKWQNIFVIGDAGNVPASKAGSVAHFMLDILVQNMLSHMKGQEMRAKFDGHANCYVETGFNKAVLIDFNYEVEPLPGTFPLPGVGPFTLLGESHVNHWGKLAFKWIYWNMLLKGMEIPTVHSHMSMRGKKPVPA
jgi:sulfide:quinone oxidoreductase